MMHIIEKIKNSLVLGSNDKAFLDRIFKNGINPYINRLKQYGFYDKQKILDAGCGFGQWTLALAQLNKEVYSCDADLKRVQFLQEAITENAITNITGEHGFIDNLHQYDDSYFDVVFCYSVLFFTPWKKSLSELVRVLKPGGTLYVNANGLGWYKHLWYSAHNKTEGYDPEFIAATAWIDTYRYKNNQEINFPCNIIIEPNELIDECSKLGLTDLRWNGEGLLGNPSNKNVFFQKEYFGDIGVYEVIGVKVV